MKGNEWERERVREGGREREWEECVCIEQQRQKSVTINWQLLPFKSFDLWKWLPLESMEEGRRKRGILFYRKYTGNQLKYIESLWKWVEEEMDFSTLILPSYKKGRNNCYIPVDHFQWSSVWSDDFPPRATSTTLHILLLQDSR